ncbi:MAG: helix-turn-helix domain-containing protein [Pseudomonadota bacterium]
MTPQQHQCLLAIRAAPDRTITIGRLADQLFVQPHTASELVDRMVSMGWLERRANSEDRRSIRLGMTRSAESLLGKMSATHRQEVVRIRDTLTELLARLNG